MDLNYISRTIGRLEGLKCSFSSRLWLCFSTIHLWLILHSLSFKNICPSLCYHEHKLAIKKYWNVSRKLGEILSCACYYLKKSWKIKSFNFLLVLVSILQLCFPSIIMPKKVNRGQRVSLWSLSFLCSKEKVDILKINFCPNILPVTQMQMPSGIR